MTECYCGHNRARGAPTGALFLLLHLLLLLLLLHFLFPPSTRAYLRYDLSRARHSTLHFMECASTFVPLGSSGAPLPFFIFIFMVNDRWAALYDLEFVFSEGDQWSSRNRVRRVVMLFFLLCCTYELFNVG